jgi:hypothetical protein
MRLTRFVSCSAQWSCNTEGQDTRGVLDLIACNSWPCSNGGGGGGSGRVARGRCQHATSRKQQLYGALRQYRRLQELVLTAGWLVTKSCAFDVHFFVLLISRIKRPYIKASSKPAVVLVSWNQWHVAVMFPLANNWSLLLLDAAEAGLP